jgi:hypothetical protein
MQQYAIPSRCGPAPQTGVCEGALQSLLTSAASLVRILLTGGTLKHMRT